MSRKLGPDRRQQDFFGAPEAEPKPSTPKTPAPRSRSGPAQEPTRRNATPPDATGGEEDGIERQLARLSPAEWRQLTAGLPDDVLARLLLAAARQLRRRLARVSRGGNGAVTSVLERAARQLIDELGSQGWDDEF